MPDQGNDKSDKLEQFFRKATSRPEVPFNEDDWRRLEARLDAEDALTGAGAAKQSGGKFPTAAAVSIALLFTAALWVAFEYYVPFGGDSHPVASVNKTNGDPVTAAGEVSEKQDHAPANPAGQTENENSGSGNEPSGPHKNDSGDPFTQSPDAYTHSIRITEKTNGSDGDDGDNSIQPVAPRAGNRSAGAVSYWSVDNVDERKIYRELIAISPAAAERNKQKAIVKLPGAEEAETGEAESVVRTENVSDQKDHATAPRLSLLLSFAPDFSSTTMSQYSTPGKAFGAMIHYHIKSRWSIGAGVIKNNKQYTGDGEDYKPPKGYWKYYTNGKIPNSIDGSCSILEFPVMVHYAIIQKGKNRLVAGGGASSYLMLDESYRYFFDEPNPGAKEGWQSGNSSRFLFNMIDFTLGYEHQILPGFSIGMEPYVKIPIEEIGWSNLKLYSTGASITLRYLIMRKKENLTVPSRSRGPD